jgi:hypothetical protein
MRELGSGDPGPQRHFHLASYFHPAGRWAYCQRPFALFGCRMREWFVPAALREI